MGGLAKWCEPHPRPLPEAGKRPAQAFRIRGSGGERGGGLGIRGRQCRSADDFAFQMFDRRFVKSLGFEQRRRRAVEQRTVLLQDGESLPESTVDELAYRA